MGKGNSDRNSAVQSTPPLLADTLRSKDGEILLMLTGVISKDTDFGEILRLFQENTHARFEMNLQGISAITSSGVREWLLFLESAQSLAAIAFSSVCEIFADIAVVVPTILGKPGTPIISFQVPLYCSTCERRTHSLLRPEDLLWAENDFSLPDLHCSLCRNPLRLDAIEKEYFKFLYHSLPPPFAL